VSHIPYEKLMMMMMMMMIMVMMMMVMMVIMMMMMMMMMMTTTTTTVKMISRFQKYVNPTSARNKARVINWFTFAVC